MALGGMALGIVIGVIPGLHLYHAAGAAVLLVSEGRVQIAGEAMGFLLVGAAVGWSFSSLIPAVFLFAPDELTANSQPPAAKLLYAGHGLDALNIMALGELFAVLMLAALAPFADSLLRPLGQIIGPHLGWMLVAIVGLLLVGEWPRGTTLGSAWAGLGAGLLTFTLSGIVGVVLTLRSPIVIERAFQNLLPAFTGLFTIPSVLAALWRPERVPPQSKPANPLNTGSLARGAATGVLGGLFAGFLPVVSGGIGGLLAGQATALRNESQFLASQGANRAAYTLGGALLLFAPGVGLTRGGLSWMLSSIFVPYGPRLFALAVGAVCLCSIAAFGLCLFMGVISAKYVSLIPTRRLAGFSLVVSTLVTLGFTGVAGLIVFAICIPIGLIPVLFGTRRMNALGIILVPATLGMNGLLIPFAQLLGLIPS